MSKPVRMKTLSAAVVVGLATSALFLSGCGNAANKVISNATGASVSANPDTGEMNITTSEGTASTSQSLPADFPGDLPRPDGTVFQAITTNTADGKAWTVVWTATTPDAQAIFADLSAKLQAAGYTSSQSSTYQDIYSAIFSNAQYGVLLTVSAAGIDGNATVEYLVGPPGSVK